MYFYKYQKMSALSIAMLRYGEVFFASPKELNDIHECRPQYIFSADAIIWSKFIHKILVTVCMSMDLEQDSPLAKSILSLRETMTQSILKGRNKRSLDYQSTLQTLGDSFSKEVLTNLTFTDSRAALLAFSHYIEKTMNEELNENYYMCSFSKNATNLTMWGHYGDAEKGFSIIYESDDRDITLESDLPLFFHYNENKNGSKTYKRSKSTIARVISVDYKSKPVRINAFSGLIHNFIYSDEEEHYDLSQTLLSRLNKFNENDLGWVKYSDWKYEKELRLHLPFYEEIPPSLRSIRINVKHIKGIIFGSRTTDSDKENIISACYHLRKSQNASHDIYFFQAHPVPNQYKLNITPLGINGVINGNYLTPIPKEGEIHLKAMEISKAINMS
ncbi:TPA: DUF2971 domain-containing protein [Enterobacter cloacae]|nr:DUF2971 domain-containing protein [Enterobacter cloacae]